MLNSAQTTGSNLGITKQRLQFCAPHKICEKVSTSHFSLQLHIFRSKRRKLQHTSSSHLHSTALCLLINHAIPWQSLLGTQKCRTKPVEATKMPNEQVKALTAL